MCCSRADVTCTNDGYLTHDSLLESFNRFIILYCKGEQPRKEALYGRIRISARIPMFISLFIPASMLPPENVNRTSKVANPPAKTERPR